MEEKREQAQPQEVPAEAPPAEAPKAEAAPAFDPAVLERLVEARLEEIRKELQGLRKALPKKEEAAAQEALLAELEALWAQELEDLPEADRKLLQRILPPSLSPVDRLKLVRGLRAAGKLGMPGVGTRAPAPASPPKPEPENPEEIARRILSLRRSPKPTRVPPGWEGR